MNLVENWAAILWRSLSLWCLYVAAAAAAVHEYIGQTAHGVIPDTLVAQIDGWAVAVMFGAGALAIPARIVRQVSLSADKPE